MSSDADVQSTVNRSDRGRDVVAVDLTELTDVEAVEVQRPGQAHVTGLLAGLHQRPRIPTVTRDVERRFAVDGVLAQQEGSLEYLLDRVIAECRIVAGGNDFGDVDDLIG